MERANPRKLQLLCVFILLPHIVSLLTMALSVLGNEGEVVGRVRHFQICTWPCRYLCDL